MADGSIDAITDEDTATKRGQRLGFRDTRHTPNWTAKGFPETMIRANKQSIGPATTGDTAMTASIFDALSAVQDIEAAGIERRQAEAIAEGMRRADALLPPPAHLDRYLEVRGGVLAWPNVNEQLSLERFAFGIAEGGVVHLPAGRSDA